MKKESKGPRRSSDPTGIVHDAKSVLSFALAALIVFDVATGGLRFLMNGWGTFLVMALLLYAGGASTIGMIVYYQGRIARGRRVDCSRMVAQSLYYTLLFCVAFVWSVIVPIPMFATSFLILIFSFAVWGIVFSGAVLVKGWRPDSPEPTDEEAPEK